MQAKQAKSLAFGRCRTIGFVSKCLSSIGSCEKSHSRGRGFDPHQLHRIIGLFFAARWRGNDWSRIVPHSRGGYVDAPAGVSEYAAEEDRAVFLALDDAVL